MRVLSGEEEGAFGWLALNQLQVPSLLARTGRPVVRGRLSATSVAATVMDHHRLMEMLLVAVCW